MPALLRLADRSVVEDGASKTYYYAAGGGVEDLDEGDEEGVDASEEAHVAAEVDEARVPEVADGEQEKRDPEQKEDAPDDFVGAKGHDPEEEGKDTPHEQSYAHRGGGRGLEPAGAYGPVQ